MPRRYYDYVPEFQNLHVLSTIGSWILITGLIIMFANLIHSLKHGQPCHEADPWGGGRTLEWKIPSPPPQENFEEIPRIDHGPYEAEGSVAK
jgi:cytochrome c oxidase subunit 1